MGNNNQQDVIDILSENPDGLSEDVLKPEMKRRNNAKSFEPTTVLKAMIKNGKIVFYNGVYKLSNSNSVINNRTSISQTQKTTSKKVTAEEDDFDYSNKEFKKRIIITGVNSKPKIKPTMNLFTFSYNFLKGIVRDYWNNLSQNPYTDKAADAIIEGYLTTPNSTNDLNDVFKELCSSLQTSSRLNNVIGFYNPSRKDGISRALFDFDVQSVANLASYECVLENLKNNLTDLNINFGSSWESYSKGIYYGAKFITRFKTYDELIYTINNFKSDNKNQKHLEFQEYQAKLTFNKYEKESGNDIYEKIPLMGEVIALNWMKEIGINNGKPDTHILDIFVECELLHSGNRNALVSDCESLLEEKAESYGLNKRYNSFGVYALDKVIWLCCSGHFYRHLNKKYNLKNYPIPNGVSISDSGWKNLKKKYLVEMMIAINNGELQL